MFHPDFLENYVSEGMKNQGIFTNHDGSYFVISQCDLFDERYYNSLIHDRYGNYKVAILPLLRVMMRSCYNFSNHQRILFKIKPSSINFKTRSSIIAPYFIAKLKKDALKQFVFSIENHLLNFFEYVKANFDINLLIVGESSHKKRYVSYNDWISLAMLFIYYDGRNYNETRSFCPFLPHFNKHNSCSAFSFKLALRNLLNWMNNERVDNFDKIDYEFTIIQLYKLDKIFKFFKANRMNFHREFLFSEPRISSFYLTFKFTYQEAINLKSILDEEVFKNDSFITECLNCEYPDPLNIFIGFLHTNAMMYTLNKTSLEINQYINPKLQKDGLNFREFVSITKEETLLFINGFVDYSKNNSRSPEKELSDVYYWKKYFCEGYESLIKYSSIDVQKSDSSDVEYLDYLFGKVIENLNSNSLNKSQCGKP